MEIFLKIVVGSCFILRGFQYLMNDDPQAQPVVILSFKKTGGYN
jgi:hypothetical protein